MKIAIFIVAIIALFSLNHVALNFIDSNNKLLDNMQAISDENAELKIELERARATEAIWWSDNSGQVITFYLRGQHEEAQDLIRQQGVRLNEIDL